VSAPSPAGFVAVLDGVVIAAADARIPIQDEGFLRGDGAFEVVAVHEGRPFALDEHLARLESSCGSLRLPCPGPALRDDIATLLAATGPRTCVVRMVVTAGGRRLVVAEPWPPSAGSVRLGLVENRPQLLLEGVKSLSYAGNMLATRIAGERGFDEALMITPGGQVLEAPRASFFWVSGQGRLLTPPLSEGILDSITRRTLLRLVPVVEERCTREDLAECREAFLAGTVRGIQPVAAIEDRGLPGAPGPRTVETAAAYRRFVTRDPSAT